MQKERPKVLSLAARWQHLWQRTGCNFSFIRSDRCPHVMSLIVEYSVLIFITSEATLTDKCLRRYGSRCTVFERGCRCDASANIFTYLLKDAGVLVAAFVSRLNDFHFCRRILVFRTAAAEGRSADFCEARYSIKANFTMAGVRASIPRKINTP
jgi:hypothetical protein